MAVQGTGAQKKLKDVLKEGADFLAAERIESPVVLAERILEDVLGCRRHELYVNPGRPLCEETVRIFRDHLEKRVRGIPAQYISGKAEFMDFSFRVNPLVLIPRPETEFLVEMVLEEAKRKSADGSGLEILDVGTGSGNIAVSLACYLGQARLCAVDISEEALQVARLNARRNEAGWRIEFLKSDFFSALPPGKKFDIIASNPPYLSRKEMGELPVEVRCEPKQALFGGERGTEAIERLVKGAFDLLKPGGSLYLEIGWEQGREVRDILEGAGYSEVDVLKDPCGRDRVARAKNRALWIRDHLR